MLLKKAKEADDKATTLAALVYIRVYSMQLSGFFEDIKDDADLLARSPNWPDLPENFKVPDQYNFPHK